MFKIKPTNYWKKHKKDLQIRNVVVGHWKEKIKVTKKPLRIGKRKRVKDKKEHLPLAEYRRRKRAEKNAIKAKERYIQEQ